MRDATATRRGVLLAAVGAGAAAGSARAQEGTTHQVDMTDDLVFDPDELTIAPGDTVVWETVGRVGHSVTAYEDEIPADAEYFASGGFDDESSARSGYPAQGDVAEGETYEHTFEVEGTYDYFCIPHESVGMLAELTVTTETAAPDEGAAPAPGVPEFAQTLGVAVTVAMVSVLALTYVLLRYGGYEDEDGPTR